jgi:hypothetical protein
MLRRLLTLAFSLADADTVTLYDLGLKLASYLLVSAIAMVCITMPNAALRKMRALLSDDADCASQPA